MLKTFTSLIKGLPGGKKFLNTESNGDARLSCHRLKRKSKKNIVCSGLMKGSFIRAQGEGCVGQYMGTSGTQKKEKAQPVINWACWATGFRGTGKTGKGTPWSKGLGET